MFVYGWVRGRTWLSMECVSVLCGACVLFVAGFGLRAVCGDFLYWQQQSDDGYGIFGRDSFFVYLDVCQSLLGGSDEQCIAEPDGVAKFVSSQGIISELYEGAATGSIVKRGYQQDIEWVAAAYIPRLSGL